MIFFLVWLLTFIYNKRVRNEDGKTRPRKGLNVKDFGLTTTESEETVTNTQRSTLIELKKTSGNCHFVTDRFIRI